jgi:general secretion pathway protein E
MNDVSSDVGTDVSTPIATNPVTTKRIGDILRERDLVAVDQLSRALRMQRENGERIGALLLQLGYVAERDLASALAEHLGIPLAEPGDYRGVPLLSDQISAEFLQRAQVIPLSETEDTVVVAIADPLDDFAAEAVRLALGKTVVRHVGVSTEIEAARRRTYADTSTSMGQLVEAIGDEEALEQGDVEQLRDLASEAPIIRVVNLIIADALEARASDIHLEPFENQLNVRYRVDGILKVVEAPPAHSSAAVVSRIKVMANLNIAERRLPQDGRIKLRIEGREIDIRVSTVPTMHGESVVMRILDKSSLPLDFPSLGFTPRILPIFEKILARPHGIVLVTGPTGSGKTTTLYAALASLNTPENKVLTVEDPVEYQLQGVNQIQVKPQIGLGFAEALRAILRQDPDVIMVGEMRDLETAKMAVQSALTGHQVFSTLHTNDSTSSVTRLLDMGVEDFLVTSTVSGVIAQRLVRTLCTNCRIPYTPSDALLSEVNMPASLSANASMFEARGCDACDGTGYRGRTGIVELLVMNDAVRQAVLGHTDSSHLREVAVSNGMVTMYEDGLAKASAGVTTLDEVLRVTHDE